jgi:hypothetical protein
MEPGCSCREIKLGRKRTGQFTVNKSCLVHGLGSSWWGSREQTRNREIGIARLIQFQATAKEARRLSRLGIEIVDRWCRNGATHDPHIYVSGVTRHCRCQGVDCDHDNRCCSFHNTHVMPHRECLLR